MYRVVEMLGDNEPWWFSLLENLQNNILVKKSMCRNDGGSVDGGNGRADDEMEEKS